MNSRRRDHFRSIAKRRYERRPFRNPYFAKSTKRLPWKTLAPGIGATLLVGALVGFVFGAERFAIRDIQINGTASISSEDVKTIVQSYLSERRWLFFHRSNRFLFDEDGLKNTLRATYVFEELAITREGKGITLTIKEKPTPFLWETKGVLWLLAEDGSAVRALTEEESAHVEDAWNGREVLVIDPTNGTPGEAPPPDPFASLPHLVDARGNLLHPGENALSKETAERVRTFLQHVQDMGMSPRQIRVDKEVGSWMDLKTADGFSILFDPALDVNTQASNLNTLLTQTIPNRTRLEYVDVRFGERVYYKLTP